MDSYGLSSKQREGFVDLIIEFAVSDTAWQADSAGVTPEATDVEPAWALAWRTNGCLAVPASPRLAGSSVSLPFTQIHPIANKRSRRRDSLSISPGDGPALERNRDGLPERLV